MAKKRRKYVGLWAVPVVIIALGFGVALYVMDSSQSKLEAEIAACRKAGMAVDASHFRKNVPSGAENAAGHYELAISRMKAITGDPRTFVTSYSGGMTDADLKRQWGSKYKGPYTLERFAKIAETWSPAIQAAVEGTTKPRLDFSRKWEAGPALAFPEYSEMRLIDKAMNLDAWVKSQKGDVKGATARLEQSRRMGLHIFQEPTIIGQLVGISVLAETDRTALRIAMGRPDDKALLDAIQGFLGRRLDFPNLKLAMDGETFFVATLPDDMSAFTGSEEESTVESRLMKLKPVRQSAQALILKAYREAWLQMPDDPSRWQDFEKIFAELDAALSKDPESVTGKVINMLGPTYGHFGQTARRMIGQRRMARVVLALYQARLKTGSFPTALPQLGEDSIDIYSGKAWSYSKTTSGFNLHGVGQDGKDDGGSSTDVFIRLNKGAVEIR